MDNIIMQITVLKDTNINLKANDILYPVTFDDITLYYHSDSRTYIGIEMILNNPKIFRIDYKE